MTTVCVVTQIPSPYQVEFFNASSGSGLSITVAYLQRSDQSRLWAPPPIDHQHCFLEQSIQGADEWIHRYDFVVFSSYRQRAARRLIQLRHDLKRPWAFWGERPGVRLPGWLGRQLRACAHQHL